MRAWVSFSASFATVFVHGVGLQTHQRGDHRQAVGDPVVDFGQQNLGLVARGDQIGRAVLHALLERRVQNLDLVAGLRDLARIAEDRDRDAADHAMMTSPPITETQRSHLALWRCSATPAVSRSSRAPDDARQEDIGLVHQRLAAIAAKDGQRLCLAEIVLERNGAVHLLELFGDHVGQPL